MITVKRDTGIVGSAMKLDVYVNNQKVGRLSNREVQTFAISDEPVELRVGFSFLKSHPITIRDGQTAVAKGSLLGCYFWIVGLKSSYLLLED